MMKKFQDNEIQILVSTSVIEVGVNVVNATTCVVLDADRFGIAQLHQMRGRVRRSDEQAYCFLVSDSEAETAVARLKLVEGNNDGFVLAEEDLIMRGPGISSEKDRPVTSPLKWRIWSLTANCSWKRTRKRKRSSTKGNSLRKNTRNSTKSCTKIILRKKNSWIRRALW